MEKPTLITIMFEGQKHTFIEFLPADDKGNVTISKDQLTTLANQVGVISGQTYSFG